MREATLRRREAHVGCGCAMPSGGRLIALDLPSARHLRVIIGRDEVRARRPTWHRVVHRGDDDSLRRDGPAS